VARRKADGTIAPPKSGGWDPNRMSEEGQQTKVVSGGNAKCDQAFLEDEAEFIVKLESKPDDCPWDVELQWQGHADELDPDYWSQFFRGTRRCTGIAYVRDGRGGYILDLDFLRLQRPCLAVPLNGAHICQKHGGQVAHVREAAQRRLSHAAEKAATTLITLTDAKDELNNVVDQGVRVKAANSVLDRAGVKAGVEVDVNLPGYKDVLQQMFGDDEEQPNNG